jgi:uncharacterized peroxidase-related enzyme
MEPMFLPGVENNPKPGSFADSIHQYQEQNSEYPQIWHLFAYQPEATRHLARYTHAVLRGPGPLSVGLRELIAAYTSALNQCPFCTNSHVAIAAEYLGGQPHVWSVVRDLENSTLAEKEKALLRFVAKVNHDAQRIQPSDMQPLYAVGWDDEAIYHTITICAMFNFYNRWIGANGVHALSEEAHAAGGKRTAANGYERD